MQEFNKVSTTSNLIKNLLISTYLPLIRTVRDFDYILAGRLYVYKCEIIKCTKSGQIVTGYQYESFGGERAEYRVLSEYYFGEKNDKLCTNYISNTAGYDSETHERLGKYLRSLRDMYDLNLMPLYNCFSNSILQAHHIVCKGNWETDKIEKTSTDYGTKVYKVPIRFNTDYTVCMENVGLTTFAPAFIKNNNLVKLNNNRFGNDVDVTNKYSRLYRTDVITNKTGLKFKQPIKLRFNNVPVTRHVSAYKKTLRQIDTLHDESLYSPVTSTTMPRTCYYIRNVGFYEIENLTEEEYNLNPLNYYYNDNGVLAQCDISMPFDPDRIYYVYDPSKNEVTYLPTDLTPETAGDIPLYTGVEPQTGRSDSALSIDREYFKYVAEEKALYQFMKHSDKAILNCANKALSVEVVKERLYDSAGYETVCLWRQCKDSDDYDPTETYYVLRGGLFYEWHYQITEEEYNNNPNGYYVLINDEYVNCGEEGLPYDPNETYYVEYLEGYATVEAYYFIFHQTEFYIGLGFQSRPADYYKVIGNQFLECNIDEEFDMNTTYAIKKPVEFFTWQVWQDGGLVPSADDHIVEGQVYYSKDYQLEEIPFTYDVTEENCAMYDYIEDNLYLLIQVPKDYDSNILVLEGDYTNTKVRKIIDESEVDKLPRPIVDYLYTSNLKLMQIPAKKIRPFSDALVEFLLWNVINNLDSINNNMDRLFLAINKIVDDPVDFQFANYWYPSTRRIVYKIADEKNNIPVTDNLGYVTKNIEQVIFTTKNNESFINDFDTVIAEEEVGY